MQSRNGLYEAVGGRQNISQETLETLLALVPFLFTVGWSTGQKLGLEHRMERRVPSSHYAAHDENENGLDNFHFLTAKHTNTIAIIRVYPARPVLGVGAWPISRSPCLLCNHPMCTCTGSNNSYTDSVMDVRTSDSEKQTQRKEEVRIYSGRQWLQHFASREDSGRDVQGYGNVDWTRRDVNLLRGKRACSGKTKYHLVWKSWECNPWLK